MIGVAGIVAGARVRHLHLVQPRQLPPVVVRQLPHQRARGLEVVQPHVALDPLVRLDGGPDLGPGRARRFPLGVPEVKVEVGPPAGRPVQRRGSLRGRRRLSVLLRLDLFRSAMAFIFDVKRNEGSENGLDFFSFISLRGY